MGTFISSLSATIVGPFIFRKAKELYDPIEIIITQNNNELWEKISIALHNSTHFIHTTKYMITISNQQLLIPNKKYYKLYFDNTITHIKAEYNEQNNTLIYKILANKENIPGIKKLIPDFKYKIAKNHRICHM
jgi:hypothetical protein